MSNRSIAIPALRKALSDPSDDVCREAISALTAFSASEARDDIARLFSHSSAAIRKASVESIQITTDEGMNQVLPLLRDPDEGVRATAVGALGTAGKAMSHVKAALGDKSAHVKSMAVRALGSIGTLADLDCLVKMLKDSEWDVRCSVVPAIAQIGRRHLTPIPWSIIKDPQMQREAVQFNNNISRCWTM
jgi:HEAT repeat protein